MVITISNARYNFQDCLLPLQKDLSCQTQKRNLAGTHFLEPECEEHFSLWYFKLLVARFTHCYIINEIVEILSKRVSIYIDFTPRKNGLQRIPSILNQIYNVSRIYFLLMVIGPGGCCCLVKIGGCQYIEKKVGGN